MHTPEELRIQLGRSEFFKSIGDGDYGSDDLVQNIAVLSGTIYGINQQNNCIISLGLNGRQTPSTICQSPIHCIDHITQSDNGSLACWSSVGVSILKSPIKPGSKPVPVNIRLGGSYIRSVRWFEESFHVLNSNNEIYSFDPVYGAYAAAPIITAFTSISDDICDFIPLKFSGFVSEFLTISTNGFLRINHDILTNSEVDGDLALGQIDTDCFVVASPKLAVHVLLLDDEAFIVEKAELILKDDVKSIKILHDETCRTRYFVCSNSGVNCVSLNWLDDVHKNGLISEKQSSCVECLVDGSISTSTIIGVSLLAGRIPNSPSFDGPVLCCAMSSGNGLLIPLLSLPTALTKHGQNNKDANRSQMPNIVNKLKSLLEKKPTRLLPANGALLPIEEQIETVARVIGQLRTEHMARGVAVREAINEEKRIIEKSQKSQNQKLKQIEQSKYTSRQQAETIADKFEAIVEKQTALEKRIVKLLVNLSSGEMSEIEKSAAREIRETGRQLTKIEKSIDRVKGLAGDIEPLKPVSTVKMSEKALTKPLTDANDRIKDLVSSLKSLAIEAGL